MKKTLLVALIVFVSMIGPVFSSFAQTPQYGGTLKIVTPNRSCGPGIFQGDGARGPHRRLSPP